jgi:hypothetical protein
MTFRMRPASKTCRSPAVCRRLRPHKNSAGLPAPHVPTDILSGGRARRSSSFCQAQRIEAQVKRFGDEDRHLRFSSLSL